MEVHPVIVQLYGDARTIALGHLPTQGNEQCLDVRKNDIGFCRPGENGFPCLAMFGFHGKNASVLCYQLQALFDSAATGAMLLAISLGAAPLLLMAD